MTKEQVLENLQSNARELSKLEYWFKTQGQSELSQYVCVKRLVNFKVQDIIESTLPEGIDVELSNLSLSLYSNMIKYRDEGIYTLADLYAAAYDSLPSIRHIIQNYLP